uniref:Uncharacterized protein n=1 Tax=Timema tahoe TaxID=61484 RepID=A0A7R9IQH7_9NEOP|nr:unnamed protein product [Timema tahoe]
MPEHRDPQLPGSMTSYTSSRFQGHGFKVVIYSCLDLSCRAAKLVPEYEEYRKNITDYERDIIKDNDVSLGKLVRKIF